MPGIIDRTTIIVLIKSLTGVIEALKGIKRQLQQQIEG